MTPTQKIVSIPTGGGGTKPAGRRERRSDPYSSARTRLIDFLLERCLAESFFAFERHEEPYPYVAKSTLYPGTAAPSKEPVYQNTAFIILLDGALPPELRKHFRLRNSNRVAWKNIRRLAPDVDVTKYRAAQRLMNSPDAEILLRQLVGLDYALVIDRGAADKLIARNRPLTDSPCRLSHMHVKVERLADNAIKDLGRSLGYIERRLFERGEDYVDALEAKFFEYYGFSPHASGRKSAAAMAAQLLQKQGLRFSILVANQDDRRLTVLGENDCVTQYFLVRVRGEEGERMAASAAAQGITDLSPYCLAGDAAGQATMLYRVRFRRTSAARPGIRTAQDRLLIDPWLAISHQTIVARPETARRRAASGLKLAGFEFDWMKES
ncbi:MAG: hypothetical protein ACE5EM_12355 [Sphingomonadales bacterium]